MGEMKWGPIFAHADFDCYADFDCHDLIVMLIQHPGYKHSVQKGLKYVEIIAFVLYQTNNNNNNKES